MATASFFPLLALATMILLAARAQAATTGVLRLMMPTARTSSTSIVATTTRIGTSAATSARVCAQWQNSSEVKSAKNISLRHNARRWFIIRSFRGVGAAISPPSLSFYICIKQLPQEVPNVHPAVVNFLEYAADCGFSQEIRERLRAMQASSSSYQPCSCG